MTLPLNPDFPPMEARSADAIPRGDCWQYEPKWDGFRCLAFRNGSAIDLGSKSGQPLGRYFPDVVEALAAAKPDRFVVDGELMVMVDGAPSFEATQMRLHPAQSRVLRLVREHAATFKVFDLLVSSDGEDFSARPLATRRAALVEFMRWFPSPLVSLSPASRKMAQAERWLDGAEPGCDGVMAKRLELAYRSGRRDGAIKIKRIRSADCVVGGFRYLQSARKVGSLLLGLYNAENRLDHVGFCSNIPAADRAALTQRLEALVAPPGFSGRAPGGPSRWSTERSGDWQPVRPEIVAEVAYDHVTGDRFRHGTTLLRFRPDKAPMQCRLEQIV